MIAKLNLGRHFVFVGCRVKILQLQKSQQTADLAEASQYKTEIQDRAEKIASRHSDALDKQEELVER